MKSNKECIIEDIPSMMTSLLLGLFVSALSFVPDSSLILSFILEKGAGIDYPLIFLVIIPTVFLFIANYRKQSPSEFIVCIATRSIKHLLSAVYFLLAPCLVSIIYWIATGNLNALGVAVLGSWFICTFTYFIWVIRSLMIISFANSY